MKNVFVFQFESDDQKNKFKGLCFQAGITLHDKFNEMINKELGIAPVIIDKEKIKFDRQLAAAKNKEKIRLIIKDEKENKEYERQKVKGQYIRAEITAEEYSNKLKEIDKI